MFIARKKELSILKQQLSQEKNLLKYHSGEVITITADGESLSHGEYYKKNTTFVIQYKK